MCLAIIAGDVPPALMLKHVKAITLQPTAVAQGVKSNLQGVLGTLNPSLFFRWLLHHHCLEDSPKLTQVTKHRGLSMGGGE